MRELLTVAWGFGAWAPQNMEGPLRLPYSCTLMVLAGGKLRHFLTTLYTYKKLPMTCWTSVLQTPDLNVMEMVLLLPIEFGLVASEPIDWVCHQTCPNGLPGVLPNVFGSGLTIPYYFLFNYGDFITNCSKICSCALLMPISHPLSSSNNSYESGGIAFTVLVHQAKSWIWTNMRVLKRKPTYPNNFFYKTFQVSIFLQNFPSVHILHDQKKCLQLY